MQEINNFKELELLQEKQYEENTARAKKSIDSNISAFSFFGSIIDLYFSRMLDVLIKVSDTGGNKKNQESKNDDDLNDIDLSTLL